jgi:hypothetical protein
MNNADNWRHITRQMQDRAPQEIAQFQLEDESTPLTPEQQHAYSAFFSEYGKLFAHFPGTLEAEGSMPFRWAAQRLGWKNLTDWGVSKNEVEDALTEVSAFGQGMVDFWEAMVSGEVVVQFVAEPVFAKSLIIRRNQHPKPGEPKITFLIDQDVASHTLSETKDRVAQPLMRFIVAILINAYLSKNVEHETEIDLPDQVLLPAFEAQYEMSHYFRTVKRFLKSLFQIQVQTALDANIFGFIQILDFELAQAAKLDAMLEDEESNLE